MTPLLLTALSALAACQSGQPAEFVPPEHALWIEAKGVTEKPWSGWGPSGPHRASAPTQGPWLALEFATTATPAAADAWMLELAGGSVLLGAPAPALPDLGLPAWLLSDAGGTRLPLDPVWLRRQGRGRLPFLGDGKQDALWLRRTGGVLDLQRGFLLDWAASGLRFQGPAGERDYRWEEVDSFAVLDEQLPPLAGSVWLMLSDGSTLDARILAQDPRAERGDFRILLPWGAEARVPARTVARIRRRDGVQEWALEPWQTRTPPAASVVDWSPKQNRSVEGRPLRLGSWVYPQGIGVRAPAEISRAAPGAGTLLVTVGADASVLAFHQPQAIVFRVFLDEVELAATPPLAATDGARPLLVAVPRAGQLRLLAEPAGEGPPHGAHADWCDLVWLPEE